MIFISSSLFSQDIILKKDGTKIEAEVLEITEKIIKYKKFNQEEGPLRSIGISEVISIIYESGEKEVFNDVKPTKKEDRKADNNFMFRSGLFLDLLLGYGNVNINDGYFGFNGEQILHNHSYFMLTLQLGNKWYFGKSEKWRPGFQATWFRYGIAIDPQNTFETLLAGSKSFSIVNIGMCNAFKLSEDTGLEINFTTGLNLEVNFYDDYFGGGLAFTPEVKYRHKNLAVGVNYSRIQSIEPNKSSDWDIISLSIGAKF